MNRLLSTALNTLAVLTLAFGSAAAQPHDRPLGEFQLASIPLTGAGKASASVAPSPGDALSLVITNPDWTSPTDLTPVSQYVNGFTGGLVLNATTPAGATSAYNLGSGAGVPLAGSGATPNLSFIDASPGYDSSGNPTTVNRTIYAVNWLRQTYPTNTTPTEAANGGNARIGLAFNDLVFASDSLGSATALSGLYTSGAVTSTAKGGIPVTNSSTLTYPRPIGGWITEPGIRIGSGQGITVEFAGGQSYGQGGVPLASVTFIASDGTHTVTKTIGTPTASAKILSTTCTATNGSAVLTACGSTAGFIKGMRLTVSGGTVATTIAGQPRLLSIDSGTQLTLGSVETCVTTLNSGIITINGTPANGDGLADGAFNGATISDANLSGGVATINADIASGDVTSASGKATSVVVHTNASTVTAASAHACTVNHAYQGVTGTVTVTAGAPLPVYSATFSAADFSGASFSDGNIWFRAQAKPVIGDVVLDSQLGANGPGVDGVTSCDWWYLNVSGTGGAGVCDSGSAAKFNVNGTDVSPNLHNLWAYLDTANTYAPKYAWVSGTAGGAPAVQSTSADPGSTAYYATVSTAVAALKTAYGGVNANGGVVCVLVAGSPYAGNGGRIDTSFSTGKPPLTITSVKSGAACPATGSANADQTVTFNAASSQNNSLLPAYARVNNLTIAASSGSFPPFGGSDGQKTTSAVASDVIYNNDNFIPTSGVSIYQVGAWSLYNSFVDETTLESHVFTSLSTTGAPAVVVGTTALCAPFATASAGSVRSFWGFVLGGFQTFGCNLVGAGGPESTAYAIQPLSQFVGYGKVMATFNSNNFANTVKNLLLTHLIIEPLNDTSDTVPALQIAADNNNLPLNNVYESYLTLTQARENSAYVEGIPQPVGTLHAVASGGAFAAATYYVMISYALKTNPTVETSTDGVNNPGGLQSAAIVLNGSITQPLPCDPNYVFYIYVDSTIAGTTTSQTLGHYATVGGVDAKALAGCQTVTLTAMGTAHTSPSLAGSTGHNEAKTLFFKRFTITANFNMKGDWYGAGTGQSGSFGSGGRVGNFAARFHAGWLGNLYNGTAIGSGVGPTSGLGENYNINESVPGTFAKYKSDRSGPTGALNLAQGDYHLDTSVTSPLGLVPTGMAAWPFDIYGVARKSGAAACGGAVEC